MEITRLGIMGGTFNPIHLGHLMIAEEARQTFHLDKVLFVPSYITPNKNVNGATAEQRLAMTRLATADNPHFTVSDMEMRRKGNSYTVDTLRFLKKLYGPSYILYFISGTDTIHDLHNWKEPEEILKLCQFVGATRLMAQNRSIPSSPLSESWGSISSSCPYRPWKSHRQNCAAASA